MSEGEGGLQDIVVVVGAGAIGRGFLPWILDPTRYRLTFVESSRAIVDAMKARGSYTTYRARAGKLEARTVAVHEASLPEDFKLADPARVAAVFVNVGPRHAARAAKVVEGVSCPVVLCENDPLTVDYVKAATSLERVYFAVPDVITSNTAPPELLAKDSLSVVSEDGVLFADARATGFEGELTRISAEELLGKQWTAKLYLHNTPHCVAAYLGALVGATYLHDAMRVPEVAALVEGSMTEMLNALKLRWEIPHPFLEWYAEKELARFRNALLCDPIARVAREPLRKLELEGRLIGAAQICLSLGFVPKSILAGIASAMLFDNPNDADRHLGFMRRALPPTQFLTHVLSLRRGEALEMVLSTHLQGIIRQLEELSLSVRGRATRVPSPVGG